MNQGACKAARADIRLAGGTSAKVPRQMKRAWARMSQKQRARLRRKWGMSQWRLGGIGLTRHEAQLAGQRMVAEAIVKPGDLAL